MDIYWATHSPGDLQLAIVRCSQQIHVNMSIHFSTREAKECVVDSGNPVLGAITLRSISELLPNKQMLVRWGLLTHAPQQCQEFLDLLQVGLRLHAPQPPPGSPSAELDVGDCELQGAPPPPNSPVSSLYYNVHTLTDSQPTVLSIL